MGNWCKEFKKWLPGIKLVKLLADKDHRFEIL